MKKNKGLKIAILAGVGVVLVAVAIILVMTFSADGYRVIKVASMEGKVSLQRNNENKDIIKGMNLKSKDIVTTGNDGLVELLADSDKHILAQENTSFEINASGNDKKGKLKIDLKYGTSLFEIDNKLSEGSSFVVNTPNASLSVRGTTFEVSYSEEDKVTKVEVTSGAVEVVSDKETKTVTKGQSATVREDEIVVSPSNYQDKENTAFLISGTDLPLLLKNAINYKEFTFLLRVFEAARLDEFDIVNGGLSIIRYEPELEGVYAPIEGTELSYDVDKLNRLFSLWTSILITEDKVPENATVNGNMITLEPATDIDYGAISVDIYNMCFTEDDMILVEYYYTVNDDSTGNSGVKGDVCVYFMPDGNGKYIFEHAMEYGNERF